MLMLQLLGGGGSGGWLQSGGWLHVLFLAFLLAVPILWPERIRVVASYRASWICFALSIFVPNVISVAMIYAVSPDGTRGSFPGMPSLQLINAAGPVLFGISLILAMKAVVPGFIPPSTSPRPTVQTEPQS